MKLMGFRNWLHWAAWFTKYFTFLLIHVIVMTIMFCVDLGSGAILNETDPSLLLVFLLVYTIASILFAMAVAVFFNTGKLLCHLLGFVRKLQCISVVTVF